MLLRIKRQGLDITPRILIVSILTRCRIALFCFQHLYFAYVNLTHFSLLFKVTRLIPDAKGTSCNQRLERVSGTEHTHILRVPFRSEHGVLRKWISRFDVWPFLETYAEVNHFPFQSFKGY